jgi:molybdate transport system substrate-binding protein
MMRSARLALLACWALWGAVEARNREVESGREGTPAAGGGEVRVAVAANLAGPFAAIARSFEGSTKTRIAVSTGATGALYAQIRNGAPFDVFLAADSLHPQLLVESRDALPGTRFTFATGRLVLWSVDPGRIGSAGAAALRSPDLRKLAIANPKIAPYGRAAQQALTRLGLWDELQPKLVFGENVGQTLRFVESGAAQLGFIALSQARDPRLAGKGSQWEVPPELHEPLLHDAVLLRSAKDNVAARALLEFLRGEEALAVLERFGYGLP